MALTSAQELLDQIKRLETENLALQKELAIKSVISEISRFQSKEGDLDFVFKRIFALLSEIINVQNFYVVLLEGEHLKIPFFVDNYDNFNSEQLDEEKNPELKSSLTAYALRQEASLNLSEQDIQALIDKGEVKVLGKLPKQWLYFPFYDELKGGLVTQSYQDNKLFSYSDMSILAYVTMHIGNFLANHQSKTKIHQQYEELKSAQSQLVQSEKMASVGQLAAGVAHEINNPLGYVNSNLNSLKDYVSELGEFIETLESSLVEAVSDSELKAVLKNESSKLKEKFDIDFILTDTKELVSESIFGMEKVKKIIQGLKNFTHAGEEKMAKANLNNCLEETIRIVWNELKYHCEVEKEYGDIPETYCHPSQLNQVFMNLLINAGHAIEEKGIIKVITKYENDSIVVSVSDNGKGIEQENLSQLFNPFFTTKPVGQGTGLGLSISYGIIESHGGKIDVQSEVGVGTTFTIVLPVIDELPEDDIDISGAE